MAMQNLPDRVRRKDLAAELGVTTYTVDAWVKRGVAGVRLRPFFVGGRIWFMRAEVERFNAEIAKSRGIPEAPPRRPKTSPEALAILRRHGVLR